MCCIQCFQKELVDRQEEIRKLQQDLENKCQSDMGKGQKVRKSFDKKKLADYCQDVLKCFLKNKNKTMKGMLLNVQDKRQHLHVNSMVRKGENDGKILVWHTCLYINDMSLYLGFKVVELELQVQQLQTQVDKGNTELSTVRRRLSLNEQGENVSVGACVHPSVDAHTHTCILTHSLSLARSYTFFLACSQPLTFTLMHFLCDTHTHICSLSHRDTMEILSVIHIPLSPITQSSLLLCLLSSLNSTSISVLYHPISTVVI